MNTNCEKVNINQFYTTLNHEERMQYLKDMIYRFAERIDKYEVAYIEPYRKGFKTVLVQYAPLFDGYRHTHDEKFWKNWFKEHELITDIPGRYITLASTGNGLVFKKIKINLKNYL